MNATFESIEARHQREEREKRERNLPLLDAKLAARAKIPGPRVGDWLRLPRWHSQQPEFTRFTHDWGDQLQTGLGSFFLFHSGHCDYSGGLNPGCLKSDLVATDELKEGSVWFFDEDRSGGGRGVYFQANMRVFTFRPGGKLDGLHELHPPYSLIIADEQWLRERRREHRFSIDKNYPLGIGQEVTFDTREQLNTWLTAHQLKIKSHPDNLDHPGYHGLEWLPNL
jgi:hypothetical protein